MTNIANIKNNLVLFFIILLGFIPSPYVINLGFLSINLDRLFLGFLSFIGILFLINKGSFRISKLHLFLLLFLSYSILNNFFLGQLQLMSIYSIILLIVISSEDIKEEVLYLALKISFLGYVFWALFSLIYFFYYGPLVQLPFSSILPEIFQKDLGHAEVVANYYSLFPRVSFPFGTPPVLSCLGAMYFLFFLHQLKLQNNSFIKKSSFVYFGLAFSLFIAIITVSKTGFAIILAGLIINFLLDLKWKINKKSFFYSLAIFFLLIIFFLFLISFIESNPISNFIYQRLFLSSAVDFDANYEGGHLNIRLKAIQEFLSFSIFHKIFGIGYLNIEDLHYHSSLLTALHEIGILGFIFLMLILFLPIKNAFHIYIYTNSKKELQKAKYVISSGVCIIVAHLVYEIPYAQFLWVFWGYLLAGSRNNEYRSEY
tara:strand:+ start:5 stop:1288 length:1284 start_codon:yes stop_codon:yes gene_type:complete